MAERGVTNYGLADVGASGELTNQYGLTKDFPDFDYDSTGVMPLNTGMNKRCRWVKNGEASSAITPRAVVKWDSGSAEPGTTVVLCGDNAIPCGVANEFLPSAGAAAGQGFFMVEEGPTELITDGGSTLATTDVVVSAASAKVNKQDASAATTDIMIQVQTRVGRPLAAVAATDGVTFRAKVGPFPA